MPGDPSPSHGQHTVELADITSIDGTVAALADAFEGYSWTSWTVPQRDHARRLRELFHVTLSEIGVPHGEVWTGRCELTHEVVGAAVALRPDREVPVEAWERVARLEAELRGERLAAAREAEAVCQPLRPTHPHVVLATLGVRRDHHRRGVATALLRRAVRTADSLEVPTYLETSSATNLALYQRSGFSIMGSVQVAGGGPSVWGMSRPPGG